MIKDSLLESVETKLQLRVPRLDEIPAIPLCVERLRMLSYHMIVLPIKEERRIGSGLLFAPESAQEKSSRGVVVAVGPGFRGYRFDPAKPDTRKYVGTPMRHDIHPGDVIQFHSRHVGTPYFLPDMTEGLRMTAEDVICIYDIAANDYDCPSNIIIAAPVEEEERVGSLFRPMNFAERPVYARVIRAGKGRFATSGERIPNEVKAGDLIAYHSRVNGIHLSLPDGSKGVVMTEAEVLAGFRE